MSSTSRKFVFGLVVAACASLALADAKPDLSAAGDGAKWAEHITAASIRADMRFLADDLLEGRGTGSRGHLIAAHYLASQFEGMGLEPAGDNGSYFQDVPIRSMKLDEEASSGSLTENGKTVALKLREDFLLSPDPGRRRVEVEAPVVFAGYGITAPSQGYDDYQGLDVKGKIVALLFGAPDFPVAVKAHYSASWLKRQNAAAHGAAGYLLIIDPALEGMYPFSMQVRDLAIPKRNWLSANGVPSQYYPQLKVVGVISMPGVAHLLEGSGHSAAEVFAAAKGKKPLRFATGGAARFVSVSSWSDQKSPNVVAKLKGSDRGLSQQYVVYSAHLDHLGISTPVNGDAIYNGALDNGSGSAALMEVARAFAALPVKPKRSLLFVAVTGEESGLLGSDYFANNPTVDKSSMIADLNMDEDLMLWPLKDVVALGAEHSTLDGVVNRAVKALHLTASPDPEPEQVAFIRSDQYSFVRQGIPSIALEAGEKSDDPNIDPAKIATAWEKDIYHHPQDDMQQPNLDFEAGALYARVAYLCGLYTADDRDAPRWNPGDFFGVAFAHAH
ncbi:MAG TPA: M28 family metallopeptidase [Steroidobacteraceae bacterium]|jgi:hypothetical protein